MVENQNNKKQELAVLNSYPTSLPALVPFSSYRQAVSKIPDLSLEDEIRLAEAWGQHQDQEAAKILVLSHLRLVLKAVRDHQGYGLPEEDLASEGTVGLMKAVHKFRPEHHVRLATYAWYWIDAEIKEYILKNWRMVSWGTSTLAKKLFFGYRKTLQGLQQQHEERQVPSSSDIAYSMGVSLEDAELARSYFLGGGDVGLLEEQQDDDEDLLYYQNYALLSYDQTPYDYALIEEDRELLSHTVTAIEQLPDRMKEIIQARYLSDKPITLSALSQKLGVSLERVRQIEKSALEMLSQKYKQFGQSD